MANSTRKAQVLITANASQATKTIQDLQRLALLLADDINKATVRMQNFMKAGDTANAKAMQKNINEMTARMQSYTQAVDKNIEKTKTLGQVIQDLGGNKLRELKSAMGQAKSSLSKLTGSDQDLKKARNIQHQMKLIGDEIRLIEGEYVKMSGVMSNIGNVNDRTLSKAIKQQQEVLSWTKRSSAAYQTELDILKKLQAEQSRRQAVSNNTLSAGDASKIARTGYYRDSSGVATKASIDQLTSAKKVLEEYRNSLPADSARLNDVGQDIADIEKRLAMLKLSIKDTSVISGDAAKKVREVLRNPDNATGNDIRTTIDLLNKRLGDLPASSKAADVVRQKIELLQKTMKGVEAEIVNVDTVMQKMKAGTATVEELKAAYKQLEQELQKVTNGDKDTWKQKREQMATLKKEIDNVTGAVNKQGGIWSTAIKNITAYVGVFGAFNMIKSRLSDVFNMNLKYSDSLNDIRKVSGLAKEQIDELSHSMAKLDTRSTQESLANLAYQGSKLGMAKYGVSGLADFVEAANQVQVAVGEDMGSDALPAVSKMVETLGLIPKMGIKDAMLATSSAMFKLSTTSTSTAGNIVEFAKRLTGVSRTAGITTDQLLALGSASDSMMLMPEVASTAMSKFIVALQKNHNLIEKQLSIPAGTIKSYYEQGKAMDAIVMVLEKMRDKGNMNALGGIFKDLGSDGQRLITAMVTMSKNVDMLKQHLYTSQEAFEDASAVTKEYEMQQESANAIMERASNLWAKAFQNPESVDAVKDMAQMWFDVSNAMTQNLPIAKTLQVILWLLLQTVKAFVMALPGMAIGLAAGGITGAIANLTTGSMALARAIVTVRNAFVALNTVTKFSWIGLAIGGITSLAMCLATAKKETDEFAQSTRSLKEYYSDALASADKATQKLKSYVSAVEDANISQKERERLIKRFNNEYGTYLRKLGIEVNSVDDLRKHYKALNAEIRKKAIYELKQQTETERLNPLRKKTAETGRQIQEELENINMPGYDRSYVLDRFEQGSSWQRVYRDIIEGVVGKGGAWGKGANAWTYTPKGGKQAGSSNLYNLLKQYAADFKKERAEQNDINKTYDAELRDYNPYLEDDLGTLENNAPDKNAEREARKAQLQQRKDWRDQLKEAEEQAKAIIDNVKNYYERQATEIIKTATKFGQDDEVKQTYLDRNEQRKNDALAEVRKAITGNDNDWNDFVLTLIQDLKEPTDANGQNESTKLLSSIKGNNLVGLRKQITTLSKNLNKPESALYDQIWLKASMNEQANAKIGNTTQQKRQKEILEHDYTGTVQKNSATGLFGMGYFSASQEDYNKAEQKVIAMLEKARNNITSVMATNGDKKSLLDLLGIDATDDTFNPILRMSADDAKLFYQKLIQYSDEFAEAQKKRADEIKKINDFLWQKTPEYKENKDAQESAEATNTANSALPTGGVDVFQQSGFKIDLENDPEVMLYKLRMEAAQEYYNFISSHNATQEQLNEANRASLEAQSAFYIQMMKSIQDQLSALEEFTDPVEDFGWSMGEAFATMEDSAEDGRKAVKAALKSMVTSWAQSLLKIMKNNLEEQVMMGQHYAILESMQETFGQTKQTIIATQGAQTLAAQQAQNSSELASEGAKEGGKVALFSAGWFAKVMSQLGWPLGPIVAAAGMATISALLAWAISKAFGSDSSESSDSASANINTKLVSGMLTYDSGNVQQVVGSDGRVYTARDEGTLPSGVSMVSSPIATTVNGEPSLVGERGPEIVIGRQTTSAIMHNAPYLLSMLAAYDKNRSMPTLRAFDEGNVGELSVGNTDLRNGGNTEVLTATLNSLAVVLAGLQKNGVQAHINKYGRGGLVSEVTSGQAFVNRH